MGRKDSPDGLTPKQRSFVKAYRGQAAGNATEAARLAGYKSPMVEGCRLLRNAKVAQAIGSTPQSNPRIASPERLQEFWSSVLEGVEEDARMTDRLKASELLAKAQGVFIERREITGKDGAPIQPTQIIITAPATSESED